MKPKIRKIPTPQSLMNAAERYLGRFAASEASLVRVLKNSLRRAALFHPEFAQDEEAIHRLHTTIGQIVEKYKKAGILNDAAFAEMKVTSLRRKGLSRSAIQQKLGAKGVKGSLVVAALEQNAEGAAPEEVELKAAIAFAKRRRLGAFGKAPDDPDRHRKDLASLARAGFSLDIARKALRPLEAE